MTGMPSALAVNSVWLHYVLEPAARALILAGVVWLLLAALRIREVSFRLAAWTIVLYAALAMPFLSRVVPEIPLPFLSPLAAQPVASDLAPARAASRAPVTRSAVFHSAAVRGDETPAGANAKLAAWHEKTGAASGVSWPVTAFLVYLFVMTILVGRFVLGWVSGRRLRRTGVLVADKQLGELLAREARKVGLRNPPEIFESAALSVPATLGVLHPAILLPTEWAQWSGPQMRAVLAHELSHIARRDGLTQALSRTHRALFWFSPLSWWLDHALTELAEHASDDAALRSGTDRIRYAEVLLYFFRALKAAHGRVRWEGVSMAQGSRSERRIERILYSSRLSRGIGAVALAAVALAAVPLICLAAAVQPTHVYAMPALVSLAPPPPPPSALTPALPAAPERAEAPPVHADARPVARPIPVKMARSENWWNGAVCRGDQAFVIVSNGSAVSACASVADLNLVWQLHRQAPGGFLWFRGNGRSYVVRDPEIVKAALAAFAPVQAIEEKQAVLHWEESKVVRGQVALGMQQMASGLAASDLMAEMQELKARLGSIEPAFAPGDASQARAEFALAQWKAMQSSMAQMELASERNLQALDQQRAALNAQRNALDHWQALLERKQAELAGNAVSVTGALIERSLARGLARSL